MYILAWERSAREAMSVSLCTWRLKRGVLAAGAGEQETTKKAYAAFNSDNINLSTHLLGVFRK